MPQYRMILVLFFVPSVVNSLVWVKLSRSYPKIGFLFMLGVAFFGFPSPIFVYIWHLYLTAFCSQADSVRSKVLANTFRLIQVFMMSCIECCISCSIQNRFQMQLAVHVQANDPSLFSASWSCGGGGKGQCGFFFLVAEIGLYHHPAIPARISVQTGQYQLPGGMLASAGCRQ